jgi:HD-like signal output (HDOD) protein
MTTASILFVDDEPNVLSGLRRMLRGKKDQWSMNFVNGGAEALSFMESTPVDVLVSDMRMPGMDGAQLLSAVQKKHPATVRVILSGQCDRELSLRAVGTSHQFLSKPCDGAVVEDVITRALALRATLTDEKLLGLVSSIPSLPAAPKIYLDLLEELGSNAPNTREIASIVSRDVALTAKLLQLTRSAYFGVKWNVRTAQQAVEMIGLDIVRALVLNHGMATQFAGNSNVLEAVWKECFDCATLAQGIAKEAGESPEEIDNAFVAGLLHDVGALVFATYFGSEQRKIEKLADTKSIPLFEAEREILGASHAEIGAYLLGMWGLPDSIVEPVAFHHEPDRCPAQKITTVTTVYLADHLLHLKLKDLESVETLGKALDLEYLSKLGVTGRLAEWWKLRVSLQNASAPG